MALDIHLPSLGHLQAFHTWPCHKGKGLGMSMGIWFPHKQLKKMAMIVRLKIRDYWRESVLSLGKQFPTSGHAGAPVAGLGGEGGKHSCSALLHSGCFGQSFKFSLVGHSVASVAQIGSKGIGHPSFVFGASSGTSHLIVSSGQGIWQGNWHLFSPWATKKNKG